MSDYPIASELSYFVLQQQRAESESPALRAHESGQRSESPRPIVGEKAACLLERLRDEIAPTAYEGRGHER